jgi:usherin
VHSLTRSIAVIYRTKPGVPEGHLNLSYITPISSDFLTFTWGELSNHFGPIVQYILSCSALDSIQPCVHYEGHETSATIWNLVPFTHYHFSEQACASGGCLHSLPIIVTTAQAPPQKLSLPGILKISPTELHVEWSPPMELNGKNLRPSLPFLE